MLAALAAPERIGAGAEVGWLDLDDVGVDGGSALLTADYHY